MIKYRKGEIKVLLFTICIKDRSFWIEATWVDIDDGENANMLYLQSFLPSIFHNSKCSSLFIMALHMLKPEAKQVLKMDIQYRRYQFTPIGEAFLHNLTLVMISSNGFQFIHHQRTIGNEYDSYSFSINYTISSCDWDLEQVYLSALRH